MKAVLGFEDVRLVCHRREIDLALRTAGEPYEIALVGGFDGYNQFFWILAGDVEYVDLPGGLSVGDLLLTTAREAVELHPKWAYARGVYSGPALALRSADATSWATADAQSVGLIVAATIDFRAGADWQKVKDG